GAAIQIGRENPEQWISYSRNHNYYANPARKRYWPVNNMYAAVVSSVDQLAGLELIEHQRMPPGNLHWQSSFQDTPELLRLFAEKKIELMLAPPERILLRDKEGRPTDYRDTEQIRRMRRGATSSIDVDWLFLFWIRKKLFRTPASGANERNFLHRDY